MTVTARPTRAVAAVGLSLLLALGGTACSSGGDDAADETTTTAAKGDDTETTETTEASDTTETTKGSDSGDVDATEQEYIDALIESYDPEDDEMFTQENIECLAAEWVPIIGVDRLREEGITPEDLASDDGGLDDLPLDEETAGELVDAMGGCGVDLKDIIMQSFESTTELTDEQRACLDEALDEDALREAMVASFMGEDDSMESGPFAEAGACLMGDMGGN